MINSQNHVKQITPYTRYLVVLADRQRARFFTIFGGNFENREEGFVDEDVPQKTKNDNGRWGKVDRHIRDRMYKHLKHVGEAAMDYLIKYRINQLDGVIVGGHKELLGDIEKFLPSKLQHKVIKKIVTDMYLPLGEVTQKVNAAL